jgi:hypothetical protein
MADDNIEMLDILADCPVIDLIGGMSHGHPARKLLHQLNIF